MKPRRQARRPRRRPARRARPTMWRSLVSAARQPVHYFKRSLWLPAAFSQGATAVFGAITFTLNNLPNAGEFTALFDEYKIMNCKVHFMPRGNSSEVGTNNNTGKLFTLIDYDDDTAPVSIDEMLQYPNCRTISSNHNHTRSLRPKSAALIYQSGIPPTVTPGYAARSGWIDCNNSSVPHYAVKYALQATAGANIFDVKIDYTVAFKGVR